MHPKASKLSKHSRRTHATHTMPRGEHRQRCQRALSDMTASYTPLRDLCAVPEEVSVVFMTEDKLEYAGTVCVEVDKNDVVKVTMWVQGSTELHHVIFCAKDFLWCRYNEVEVLFWKRPIVISNIALRFRFKSDVDAHNFMQRVVR